MKKVILFIAVSVVAVSALDFIPSSNQKIVDGSKAIVINGSIVWVVAH